MSISGLIIQAKPQLSSSVRSDLEQIPGVDVHAQTEDGSLIITVDEPNDADAAEILMNLRNINGVLATSLVYSHFDGDSSDEEYIQ